jgi:hypothetical protein
MPCTCAFNAKPRHTNIFFLLLDYLYFKMIHIFRLYSHFFAFKVFTIKNKRLLLIINTQKAKKVEYKPKSGAN